MKFDAQSIVTKSFDGRTPDTNKHPKLWLTRPESFDSRKFLSTEKLAK